MGADKDAGLVSFRAGRLFLDENTKMVTADKKRGKIKLSKDEQGLLKFQWFNRISNQKELDLTVFPTSAKWEKVSECTDGRVFLLRMMGSNRKHFFWMQEPKDDKDEEIFTNINKLCNGESIGDKKPDESSSEQTTSSNPYASLGGFVGNANAAGSGQDAMAKMILDAIGNAGGNNNNNGSGTGNNAGGDNQNNLMAQMAQMMQEQQRAAMEEMKREPDLEDILDPNANQEIMELLDDEKIVEELGQHLPESMRSRRDIVEQLQSPQFQGALRRLQRAVNGPQMNTLLQQMGINGNNNNQNAMGVTSFVNAIQPEEKKEDKKDAKKDKDDDGDSEMANKDKKDDTNKKDDDDIYK